MLFFSVMLFEADYAKNYASILYQCLPANSINQKVLFVVRSRKAAGRGVV